METTVSANQFSAQGPAIHPYGGFFSRRPPLSGLYLLYVCLAVLLGLSGCANSIPPQGGPKDETPPKLVEEKSTPNYQTNFQKQDIELTFDEWVQLKDPYQQVVVSPPLPSPYTLRIKGKTVIFRFAEADTLRANATYTINFGTAIQDLTEGNPADVRFVFATGDKLDSLELSGKVVDALTGEAVENVLFMLYENLADTVVRKERPFYFGKTDTAGQFQISNIREGVFKGFALKDANANYKFDQEGEAIGFPDSLIRLSDSLPAPQLRIRLFQEEKKLRLADESTETFGVVKLAFNRPPDSIVIGTIDGPSLYTDYDRDTLRLWYAESDAPWRLLVSRDTSLRDTVNVPVRDRAKFLQSARLKLAANPSSTVTPGRPLYLRFNHPVGAFDTTRMQLLVDTNLVPVRTAVAVDTPSQRALLLSYAWREGQSYNLQWLPGAVTDIYGLYNRDTITHRFRGMEQKDFGTINLAVSGLDTTQHYLVQIITKDGASVAERRVDRQAQFQEVFRLLPPGQYLVQVVTDWNRNGRWDTGNYDRKRQPEPVFRHPLEQLRANWDIEAKVSLEE